MLQKALLGILVAAVAFLAPVQRSFDSWKSYGGGVDSSQYSSLKLINKTNVKQLQVAWTFPVGGNTSTSPLVVDGVMYVPRAGQAAAIVALDATTGKELWSASPGFDVAGYAISYTGANGKQYVVISGPRMVAYALP